MAEDNDTALANQVSETNAPVESPVAKKTRAPRQPKTVVAHAVDATAPVTSSAPTAGAAKPAGPGRGRKAKSVVANAEAPVKVKGPVKATRVKTAKPFAPTKPAPAAALDEIEDLIKLEEDNKRLRQLLSDKLRGENADLRKRLGHK